MTKDNKKILIFDFDGVFYSGEHKFDLVKSSVDDNRRIFLPKLNNNEYDEICKSCPDFLTKVSGNDIVKEILNIKSKFPNYNISTKHFYKWQKIVPYTIIIDEREIADIYFIKLLCQNYKVYVVSNSSFNHIKFYMNKIGINYKWFKKIYSNHFLEDDISKKRYYLKILNREKVKNTNCFVFGDSIETDLLPAKDLGMNTIYIDNANNIPDLVYKSIDDSSNLKDIVSNRLQKINNEKYLLEQESLKKILKVFDKN